MKIKVKKRSLAQLFIVIILCYLCYLLGLFTHMLEKDLTEFRYPSQIDISMAINRLEYENIYKYVDINNHNYTFIYKSKYTCNRNNKNNNNNNNNNNNEYPYLIILVKSKLTHFEQRNTIRETWGKINNKSRVRTVFLLGVPAPEELSSKEYTQTYKRRKSEEDGHHQIDEEISNSDYEYLLNKMGRSRGGDARLRRDIKSIDKNNENDTSAYEDLSFDKRLKLEYELYGDIVQQNFYDTYYNNTLKAIMGLKWINKYCSNANYYLFIDDDYYLNPNLLINYLNSNLSESVINTLYAGFVFENSSPMRHLLSKWYISLQEYPYDKFPPYVSAGCYVLSQKSARLFYMATKLITIFRFDDVYLGIIAHKLNIKPLHIDNIHFYPPSYSTPLYENHIIASHGFTTSQLRDIWRDLEVSKHESRSIKR